MNKKAGNPIAIALIVVATLVLMIFALFTFLTKDTTKQIRFESSSVIDAVYIEESTINFYIQQIVTKAAAETPINDYTKTLFLENVKKHFDAQSLGAIIPETQYINLQLDPSNVQIHDDKISLTLRLKVEKNKLEQGEASNLFNKEALETFTQILPPQIESWNGVHPWCIRTY